MARRRVLWLALLGLLSVVTYWCAFAWPYGQSQLVASGSEPDIALLTDHSPGACALYVGAVTLLFGLYLAAVRLASRLRGSSAHVVVHLCLVRPDVCGDLRLCGPVGGGRAKPGGVLQFQHWVCLWAADSRVPLAPSLLGPPAESTYCDLTRSCILTRTRPTPIIAV